MKKILLLAIIFSCCYSTNAQTCKEFMQYIKSNNYGTTYTSYDSDAISKVTFYSVTENYSTDYYAIVCFKNGYINCTEYIYQVGSGTKFNYSLNYLQSAGKAFWSYIQPYNKYLKCGASFND